MLLHAVVDRVSLSLSLHDSWVACSSFIWGRRETCSVAVQQVMR